MNSQDDRYSVVAVSLVGVLLALFWAGTAFAQGYEFPQPCAGIDYFTSNMPPDPEFDIQHIATDYLNVVDPSIHDAVVDMIFDNTAFLDSVPPYVTVYQLASQGMTPDSFPDYYALLDTLVDVGDSLFELTWELLGTANGADTFWTYALVSLEGCTEFEPLMYFNEGGFDTVAMMPQGVGEGISWWFQQNTKLGTKGVRLDIDISFECDNCRISDYPPYTDLSFTTGLFWTADAQAIESKYFKPALCCPEDKVECLKSQVKIAWASGFKSVSVSANDLSVSVSGHLGCQGQWQKTLRVCCVPEPTGVELATFTARVVRALEGPSVGLLWETASEIDNAGFNVYRGASKVGRRHMINKELIAACGDELKGQTYAFSDCDVTDGRTYHYWLEDVDLRGKATMHGPVSATVGDLTAERRMFSLAQNAPNPFKVVTDIRYELPVACDVHLAIYNLMGQMVRTLVHEHQDAGPKIVRWDGRNEIGEKVSGGVYFCRIQAGSHSEMKKTVYLR